MVEHEDAVFVDDAHADDGAEEGDDVEGGAGDEQCGDDSEDGRGPRRRRSRWARGRIGIPRAATVKTRTMAHDQDEQQVVEGFLLLLVEAAVFDGAGGDGFCPRRRVWRTSRHGAAEVAVFQIAR